MEIVDNPEPVEMQNEPSTTQDDKETYQELDQQTTTQHIHDITEEGAMATDVLDEPNDATLVANATTITTTTNVTTTTTATSRSAVRHPLSGWMIFSQQTREQVMRENPGMVFTEVAKILSEKYRSLSTEEKERLDGLAKADKVRYLRELEEVREFEALHGSSGGDASGSGSGGGSAKTLDLVIPVGRVRKIVKLDKDVKNVSKEAMAAITKTTELFVAYMGVRCAGTAALRGARTIRDQDVAITIHSQNAFDFLRLDFPKIPKKTTPKHASSSGTDAAAAKKVANANHSKPTIGAPSIKSFFAPMTAAPEKETIATGAPSQESDVAMVDENEYVGTGLARSQNGDDVEV